MSKDVCDLLQGEREPETMQQTLDGLVEYRAVHFKREEDYFALAGYASGMPQETMPYLHDWSLGSDRRYADHFHKFGIR